MPSLTVYPSLDGSAGHSEIDLTWAELRVAPGDHFNDTAELLYAFVIAPDPTTNLWFQLDRGLVLFYVSLPDYFTITSVSLFLWGLKKVDTLNISPDMNIYSSSPASNTGLEAGDFTRLGSIPFCDTPLTYANCQIDAYNEFVLNTAGLAALAVALAGDGILKLGLRNANYDVSGTIPAWAQFVQSYMRFSSADSDTDKRPGLVITYTIPTGDLTPYFLWGEGEKLDFTDHFGYKRRLLGVKEGQTGKSPHQVSVQGFKLGYTDVHGDEMRLYATKRGFTGKSPNQISIQGTEVAFIDENGDERYCDAGGRGNSSVFNQSTFN